MSTIIESAETPHIEKINEADRKKFRQLVPNFLTYCNNFESKDKYPVDPEQLEKIFLLMQSRQDWEIEAMAADYILSAPKEIKQLISLPWLFERLMRYGQVNIEEDSDSSLEASRIGKPKNLKTKKIKTPRQYNSSQKLSSQVNKNVAKAKKRAEEADRQNQELNMDPSDFWRMLEAQEKNQKLN